MEESSLRMWIITLVVLYGLSLNSYGQKTFRRSCDCEYMVDGKCAYTLLLPTGQGEGMCPQSGSMDSNDGEMSGDMQRRVNDLQRNLTQLLSMYSSQSTMLNQVYSTLMDKLLTCPLLVSCAMPNPEIKVPVPTMKIPDVTMPDVAMPDITMPDIEIEKPEFTMPDTEVPEPAVPTAKIPEVTMPDIENPEFTMPDIDIPMPTMKCKDICPDIDSQIESLRIMAVELDSIVASAMANITLIFNQMSQLNATVIELGTRVLLGNSDPRPGASEIPGTIPGMGGLPNPKTGGLPDASLPKPNMDVTLAGLGSLVNTIINSGAICFKKGPLVSGQTPLPDESITASTSFNEQHVPSRVRIHSRQEGNLSGAWCPGKFSPLNALNYLVS